MRFIGDESIFLIHIWYKLKSRLSKMKLQTLIFFLNDSYNNLFRTFFFQITVLCLIIRPFPCCPAPPAVFVLYFLFLFFSSWSCVGDNQHGGVPVQRRRLICPSHCFPLQGRPPRNNHKQLQTAEITELLLWGAHFLLTSAVPPSDSDFTHRNIFIKVKWVCVDLQCFCRCTGVTLAAGFWFTLFSLWSQRQISESWRARLWEDAGGFWCFFYYFWLQLRSHKLSLHVFLRCLCKLADGVGSVMTTSVKTYRNIWSSFFQRFVHITSGEQYAFDF